MNHVVRNTTTKRKLNWEQEEAMRSNKKKGEARREVQRNERHTVWEEQE